MARVDEYVEKLATLLEVSRTPEGRASLSDELRDILHLLPASPSRLLLLRLLRNLLAGDVLNQTTFIRLSGSAAVASSVLSSPSAAADVSRAALQALGNAALAGEHHRAAVWEALFPGALREFAGVEDAGVLDPLCMVLDTCCSGEGGRARLEELCHDHLGPPVLVEVVTTASKGTLPARFCFAWICQTRCQHLDFLFNCYRLRCALSVV
jgi:ataxin-10